MFNYGYGYNCNLPDTEQSSSAKGKQQKIYLRLCCQGTSVLNELMNHALSFLECKRNFNRKQFRKKVWTCLQS